MSSKRRLTVSLVFSAALIVTGASGCSTANTGRPNQAKKAAAQTQNQSGKSNSPTKQATGAPGRQSTSTETPQPVLANVRGVLTGIHMFTDRRGWAVTMNSFSQRVLLRTVDGGVRWSAIGLPGGKDWDMVGYRLEGSRDAMVVMQYLPKAGSTGKTLHLYSTNDGGRSWSAPVGVSLAQAIPVQKVTFSSSGSQDRFMMVQVQHGMSSEPGALFVTSDGGRKYTEVASTSGQDSNLPDGGEILFTSRRDGWLAAANSTTSPTHLYHTTDGGRRWTPVDVPVPPAYKGMKPASISAPFYPGKSPAAPLLTVFFQATHGLNPCGLYQINRDTGKLRFIGGLPHNWGFINQSPGRPSNLSFVNAQVGFLQAESSLYRTGDGGATWQPVTGTASGLPLRQTVSANPQEIDFVSPQTGYELWNKESQGKNISVLYKTSDGGRHWSAIMKTLPL